MANYIKLTPVSEKYTEGRSDDRLLMVSSVVDTEADQAEAREALGLLGVTPPLIDLTTDVATTSNVGHAAGVKAYVDANAGAETVAFWDDFDDRSRYEEGRLITHGTTPAVGNPWRLSVAAGSQTTDAPVIFGGLLGNNGKLFYLGSSFSHEPGKFDLAYEFTPDTSKHSAPIYTNVANISFSTDPNLIHPAGGSIGVGGAIHLNFTLGNLAALNFFSASITFQGNAGTDILTTASNHGFQTGWPVGISGAGAVPGGVVSGGTYYAIVLSPTTLKLALSRNAAIAGIAVNLTSDGTAAARIEHGFEPLNRRSALGTGPAWRPPSYQNVLFQANAGTDIVTTFTLFRTGDIVKLWGAGLPSPLLEQVEYYVYRSGNDIYLCATELDAYAGTFIDLTTNGSANQTITGYATENVNLAQDKRYVLTIKVDGEIIKYGIIGVGEIILRSPRLAQVMAGITSTSFWWETVDNDDAPGSQVVSRLHSIAANAPSKVQLMRDRASHGLWELLSANPTFPKGLRVLPAHTKDRFAAGSIAGGSILSGHAGGSTDVGNGNIRATNGNIFIQGLYAANIGYFNPGGQEIAYAPMRSSIGLNAALSSAAGSETVRHNAVAARALAAGDCEEHIINFRAVGAAAKRIRLTISPDYIGGANIFDTATDLDAVSGTGTIRMFRQVQTGISHVYTVTITCDTFVKVYPRMAFHLAGSEHFTLQLRTTTVDAGGIIFDTGYREVTRLTSY